LQSSASVGLEHRFGERFCFARELKGAIMMQHLSTTPFGRRGLSLGQIASQVSARAVRAGAVVHKWRAFQHVREARERLGATDRALAILNALLTFHPETALTGTSELVVWPSNAQLMARANGMPATTLRRHLAVLVDCGLIIRRDSPNGKRFARKDREGGIEQAYGFDLSPIVARAEEFAALAEAVQAEKKAFRLARERLTLLRRDIVKMIEAGVGEGAPGDWGRALDTYRAILAGLPRAAPRAVVEAISEELRGLHQQIREALESFAKAKNQAANESHCGRHIQNSNPDLSLESENGWTIEEEAESEAGTGAEIEAGAQARTKVGVKAGAEARLEAGLTVRPIAKPLTEAGAKADIGTETATAIEAATGARSAMGASGGAGAGATAKAGIVVAGEGRAMPGTRAGADDGQRDAQPDRETGSPTANPGALKNLPPRELPLNLVLDACADLRDLAQNRDIRNWRDFVEAAELARPLLAISPSAWKDAREVLGDRQAAITLAAIHQRAGQIANPGGYLRNLTGRARQGKFSTGPMVMALLRLRLEAQQPGRRRPAQDMAEDARLDSVTRSEDGGSPSGGEAGAGRADAAPPLPRASRALLNSLQRRRTG
jgi:DNA-binding transcriptional ArsR family regulator